MGAFDALACIDAARTEVRVSERNEYSDGWCR
jgi:hypothetical protein